MKWFKKSREPTDLDTRHWFKPHLGSPMFALIRPALLNAAAGVYESQPPRLYPLPCAVAMANEYNFEYTPEFVPELAIISMTCVTFDGDVQNVQVRKHYLGYTLKSLAANLNLDIGNLFQSLVEGKRAIVACAVGVDPPKPIYSAPHQAFDALSAEERRSAKEVTWYHYKPTRFVSSSMAEPPMPIGSGFLVAEALGPLKTPADEYFFPYTATTTGSDMEGVIELEEAAQHCLAQKLSALPEPGRERWCTDFLRPALQQMQAKIRESEARGGV